VGVGVGVALSQSRTSSSGAGELVTIIAARMKIHNQISRSDDSPAGRVLSGAGGGATGTGWGDAGGRVGVTAAGRTAEAGCASDRAAAGGDDGLAGCIFGTAADIDVATDFGLGELAGTAAFFITSERGGVNQSLSPSSDWFSRSASRSSAGSSRQTGLFNNSGATSRSSSRARP
jgi:hypothetical protein